MRYRPLRGEKYRLPSGEEVMVLEVLAKGNGSWVEVMSAKGFLRAVPKEELGLSVIDTAHYEKL